MRIIGGILIKGAGGKNKKIKKRGALLKDNIKALAWFINVT